MQSSTKIGGNRGTDIIEQRAGIHGSTLLTTEPNAEIRDVGHHRKPAILQSDAEYACWLNPAIVERGPLDELMRPLPDGSLAVEAIGTLF